MSIRVLASREQCYRFNTDFFALLNVHGLRFETAALDPALVHPQQHVGPIARFGAARAGVNGEKGVGSIVLTRKELAQLEFLQLMNQAVMFGRDFLLCMRATRRVAFFRSQLL